MTTTMPIMRLSALGCDVLRLIGNDPDRGAFTVGVYAPADALDTFEDVTDANRTTTATARVVALNSGRSAFVVEALPRPSATQPDEYTAAAIAQRLADFAAMLDHVGSHVSRTTRSARCESCGMPAEEMAVAAEDAGVDPVGAICCEVSL